MIQSVLLPNTYTQTMSKLLREIGRPLSDEMIMGLSALCFRFSVRPEAEHPKRIQSYDKLLCNAMGMSFCHVVDPAEQREIVLEKTSKGEPVLCYNRQAGGWLLLSDKKAAEAVLPQNGDNFFHDQINFRLLLPLDEPLDWKEACTTSIQFGMDKFRSDAPDDGFSGLYEWIAGLEDGTAPHGTHRLLLARLRESRCYAAAFLKKASEAFSSLGQLLLKDVIKIYEETSEKMIRFERLFEEEPDRTDYYHVLSIFLRDIVLKEHEANFTIRFVLKQSKHQAGK